MMTWRYICVVTCLQQGQSCTVYTQNWSQSCYGICWVESVCFTQREAQDNLLWNYYNGQLRIPCFYNIAATLLLTVSIRRLSTCKQSLMNSMTSLLVSWIDFTRSKLLQLPPKIVTLLQQEPKQCCIVKIVLWEKGEWKRQVLSLSALVKALWGGSKTLNGRLPSFGNA